MSTGIKVGKFVKSEMSWNLTVGYDTGIDIEEVEESLLHGNIIVSKNTIDIFGKNFSDVATAVIHNRDEEGLVALADIFATPKQAVSAWVVLAKKYGQTGHIGQFTLSTLSGVLSQTSFALLKIALQAHGIHLP
jgi:hypothetical protein